ncbi:MAG: Ohr family peroxiredoxin [Alphaproteobacteria bacterium TMED89]|nr:organic hydroperoxide resistance protein [Rhodospirillaceae bacterium]MAV48172.1 organic hydroperoxide resistance protein [Rhodospirillaceae bacterium]RPH11935.1 MAG: Ohr family peroxiredoxin [Alphaproteobacteria bacterium TMED89]RPH11952.1 MAG: Ohr family peroxiredoxin [Alphaproteobacteria bacterium TMED89]
MNIYHKTAATARGGRSGSTSLDNGTFSIDTVLPGAKKEGLTPEELFTLGYAACFDNAMKEAAKFKEIELGDDWHTQIAVGLGNSDDNKRLRFDVDITAMLPGMDQETADRLMATTHKLCPFSNSLSETISVRLKAKTTLD